MKSTDTPWTPERIEAVAHMWQRDGLSATQIATALGAPYVTRNAVIGVIYRRGLSGKGERPHSAPRRTTPRAERRSRPKTQTFVNAVAVAHNREARKLDRPIVEKAQPHAPTPLLIPLIELKPRQCRWPIGDPGMKGFGFCGHGRKENSSYCSYHHGVGYTPATLRRIREPA